MNKKFIILAIALIVGMSLFFGGMKFGENKRFSRNGFQLNANGDQVQFKPGAAGLARTSRSGASAIMGEITSKDDKSMTVKLPDGGSRIVFFSDSTAITKSADGTLADLIIGESILINGNQSSDGSIIAQLIQLRPTVPKQ